MSNATVNAAPPSSRQPRPRPKPARFCKLTQTDGVLTLVIRQQLSATREQVDAYTVTEIDAGDARAFHLTKHDGQTYDVCLDGQHTTCDCLGFTRWSHRGPCKHVASLQALIREGKL